MSYNTIIYYNKCFELMKIWYKFTAFKDCSFKEQEI